VVKEITFLDVGPTTNFLGGPHYRQDIFAGQLNTKAILFIEGNVYGDNSWGKYEKGPVANVISGFSIYPNGEIEIQPHAHKSIYCQANTILKNVYLPQEPAMLKVNVNKPDGLRAINQLDANQAFAYQGQYYVVCNAGEIIPEPRTETVYRCFNLQTKKVTAIDKGARVKPYNIEINLS
jgi:hypothetical protein